MRSKLTTILMLVICMAFFTNCGDSNKAKNCAQDTIASEISDESAAVSAAALAYANDPSASNCTALKNAYQDLIDAYKDLEDCAASINQTQQWQQGLDAAEAALDSVC